MQPNILKALADNPALMDEVKRVILAQFEFPAFRDEVSDENLGQVVRARMTGRRLVEEAFREIATHKTPTVREPGINGAR